MGAASQKVSLEDYLSWENEQPTRHEFWRGEIFAMVGGQRGHGRVIANFTRHLGNHLDDGPCQVFAEGMKVRVGDEAVLYPDVFVSCDREFSRSDLAFTQPVLVIEVLSLSTQAYDRSAKFAIYRGLPSLREYALVDPDTRRVELLRLGDDGLWNLLDMSDEPALVFESIDCRIALADVFKGMDSSAPVSG